MKEAATTKGEPTTATIPPIEKVITVPWPVAEAFDRFTAGIAGWWPLTTHSVGEKNAETCAFEGRVGGRIYEVTKDGTEHEWGRVTLWDPPRRTAFTWYPGRTSDTRQEVEVRFIAEGSGTRVELTHAGWERLGDKGREMRKGYDSGWDFVLGLYAA